MIMVILLLLMPDSLNIPLYSQLLLLNVTFQPLLWFADTCIIYKSIPSSICLCHRPKSTVANVGERVGIH